MKMNSVLQPARQPVKRQTVSPQGFTPHRVQGPIFLPPESTALLPCFPLHGITPSGSTMNPVQERGQQVRFARRDLPTSKGSPALVSSIHVRKWPFREPCDLLEAKKDLVQDEGTSGLTTFSCFLGCFWTCETVKDTNMSKNQLLTENAFHSFTVRTHRTKK